MRFFSDNTASACPEILAALAGGQPRPRAQPMAMTNGRSAWTRCFSDYFGTAVRAFAVTTGTAANALSLATLSPPYGAIFAHQEAHIETDECGAPGFFTGGAQLMLLPGEHGRIDAGRRCARRSPTTLRDVDLHSVQPAALSLTQATELGTAYRRETAARARASWRTGAA